MGAELDMVFRKDTDGLWEELLQSSKRIRAQVESLVVVAR